MTNTTIQQAKRLIAAASPSAASILGMGIAKPCSQARYNAAASVALGDPTATLTDEQRQLVASFIVEEGEAELRDKFLTIRLSDDERERLRAAASASGLTSSEYLRSLFPPLVPEAGE